MGWIGLARWRWCRAAAIVLLAGMLSGCASMGKPVVLNASFDPAAAAVVNAPGKASVSGQAFVRQNNGRLLRAVGTDIYLIPRTAYSDERIAALYGDGKQLRWGANVPEADPLFEHYMRKTVASSGGSFKFDRVADGEYYIVAMIHLPSDHVFRQFPIMERVIVTGGKSVRVVMRGY